MPRTSQSYTALVSHPLSLPIPDPEADLVDWLINSGQRPIDSGPAHAPRPVRIWPRGSWGRLHSKTCISNEDALQLRLYHWPAEHIEIALCSQISFVKHTWALSACRRTPPPQPQRQRQWFRPPAYHGPILRCGAADRAYTGSRLCHLPRSLIKGQPNTSRGGEVHPAWGPQLGSWLHKPDGVLDGMWPAGKYQGPRSTRPRLSGRGSSAAAQPLPTNMSTTRLLLWAVRTTLRSLPSNFIERLQSNIGQRFIWRVDSDVLALGVGRLSRQVVPQDTHKLSRILVTRDPHNEMWSSRNMSTASSIKSEDRRGTSARE